MPGDTSAVRLATARLGRSSSACHGLGAQGGGRGRAVVAAGLGLPVIALIPTTIASRTRRREAVATVAMIDPHTSPNVTWRQSK